MQRDREINHQALTTSSLVTLDDSSLHYLSHPLTFEGCSGESQNGPLKGDGSRISTNRKQVENVVISWGQCVVVRIVPYFSPRFDFITLAGHLDARVREAAASSHRILSEATTAGVEIRHIACKIKPAVSVDLQFAARILKNRADQVQGS